MPTPNGVHALVRRTHEDRVLRVLRERGALSRGEIARAVGLSRTTLSEITNSLLARGAVIVVDTDAAERNGSGRPAERLALDPRSGQFMGIDFGHVRVNVAIADAAHEIVAAGSARYRAEDGWEARLPAAFALIDRLAADTGVHYGALQAIGIGVPGPVTTTDIPTPEGWGVIESGVTVDAAFGDRFGAPVIVDNNTRFAALAEALEASDGAAHDVVYVRLSDGVGGGLVVGGRLVTGSGGLAGELGHVRAVRDGRPCRCGKEGCLETIASVPAILAECRARGVDLADLAALAAAVRRAHPVVDDVLRDAASALGRVLASAATTLNPSLIIVGGEIVRLAPVLLGYVRATLRYELFPGADVDATVRPSALGDDDGALGAIAALFHQSPLLAGYPDATAADRSAAASPVPLRRSTL